MKPLNYAAMGSLCALVMGVLLVAWPGEAMVYLVVTVGVLFLLPGLIGLLSFFASSRGGSGRQKGLFPVVSLGSTLLGIWLVVMPDFFINTLMYLLGALLVLGGAGQLLNFFSVRAVVKVPVVLYLVSAAVLAAGVVILFNPFEAATVPFIVLGVSCIVYALNDLLRLLRYRRKKDTGVTDVEIVEE